MRAHPRVGVVGHLEWVEFARVPRVPTAGEIAHAEATWQEPAGGGPVASVQLAKLAGACSFFTSLGDDELGRRAARELEDRYGVRVHAAFRTGKPTRRAFTFIDRQGERTITVIGERLGPSGHDDLPWDELDRLDAVYLCAGDRSALQAARRARVLVATSRIVADLASAGIALDALVGSARDPGEAFAPGALHPPPRLVVRTAGSSGGSFETAEGRAGRYPAQPPPGPVADAYGCGDSFAAGLTYGLGAEMKVEDALELAARCGAACITGHGPYEGQLRLARR